MRYPIAPNRLARNFEAAAPNQIWLADLTYIPTGEGWLYLAAILDMHTRKIVGWSALVKRTGLGQAARSPRSGRCRQRRIDGPSEAGAQPRHAGPIFNLLVDLALAEAAFAREVAASKLDPIAVRMSQAI